MSISSRTPEGFPNFCPVCGGECRLEPSLPAGDAPCPRCGHLLWWFQQRFGNHITPETSFRKDLGADSLDVVEFVMEIEAEWGIQIPDDIYGQIKTVKDAMRLVEQWVKP